MSKVSIDFLFEKPTKFKEVVLKILPLAPLSIVTTMPGSYYKSIDSPNKVNLSGMFENMLGWHFGKKDRNLILKKIKKVYKKEYKIDDLNIDESESGYKPLIGHLFEILLPVLPTPSCRYDDYWTQQMKHDDVRHLKGTPNLSWQLIKLKASLEKEKGKVSDAVYTTFFKQNKNDFPRYYTSPTLREFIVVESSYQYKLKLTEALFNAVRYAIDENNTAYIGTSEGWVHLSIKEIKL